MKNNVIIHSDELHRLAREINDRESTILLIRSKVEEALRPAGPEIIMQGQTLLRAKVLIPHGLWLDWLAANCPQLSARNAQRYMARASNTTLSFFYHLLCDPEPASGEKPPPRQWPPYVEAIGRAGKLAGQVRSLVEKFPIERWPEEGRQRLREEIEPLARMLWPEKFPGAIDA